MILASCGGGGDGDGDDLADDLAGGGDFNLSDFDVESPWSGEGSMTISFNGVTETIDGFRCVRTLDDGTTSIGAEGGPWESGEFFDFTVNTTGAGIKVEFWERGKNTVTWGISDRPPGADSFSGTFEVFGDGISTADFDYSCIR